MPESSRCVSTPRSVVIWVSAALALGGWGGGGLSWFLHGQAAGIRPGFIFALSAGIAFTITCSQAVIMPDKVKLYGLGFRDGVHHADEASPDPEPGRRLTAVR